MKDIIKRWQPWNILRVAECLSACVAHTEAASAPTRHARAQSAKCIALALKGTRGAGSGEEKEKAEQARLIREAENKINKLEEQLIIALKELATQEAQSKTLLDKVQASLGGGKITLGC